MKNKKRKNKNVSFNKNDKLSNDIKAIQDEEKISEETLVNKIEDEALTDDMIDKKEEAMSEDNLVNINEETISEESLANINEEAISEDSIVNKKEEIVTEEDSVCENEDEINSEETITDEEHNIIENSDLTENNRDEALFNGKFAKIKNRFGIKPKVKNVLHKIKNILCWTLIVALVATLIIILSSKMSGQTPSFFGYTIFRVNTGSMEPELMVGDIILDKEIEDVNTLKKGDIVTFHGTGQTSGMLVTHKIIKAPYQDENGKIMLQTKGVANDIADDEISAERLVGVMICKIPFLDILYNVFLSPFGLLILMGLLLFVFIDEIICIVQIVMGKGEKKENISDIIERIQAEDTEEESTLPNETKVENADIQNDDLKNDNNDIEEVDNEFEESE